MTVTKLQHWINQLALKADWPELLFYDEHTVKDAFGFINYFELHPEAAESFVPENRGIMLINKFYQELNTEDGPSITTEFKELVNKTLLYIKHAPPYTPYDSDLLTTVKELPDEELVKAAISVNKIGEKEPTTVQKEFLGELSKRKDSGEELNCYEREFIYTFNEYSNHIQFFCFGEGYSKLINFYTTALLQKDVKTTAEVYDFIIEIENYLITVEKKFERKGSRFLRHNSYGVSSAWLLTKLLDLFSITKSKELFMLHLTTDFLNYSQWLKLFNDFEKYQEYPPAWLKGLL